MGRRETTNAAPARSRRLIDYPRSGRRGVRRWLPSWTLLSGLVLLGLAFAAGLFAVGYASTTIPDPNELVDAQTTTVYWAGGRDVLGEFAAQDRTLVTADRIPEHVEQAVIAAEDRSFYENRGISITGIARAFWNNLRGNATQGGSTITQQYVKNYFLEPEQTYRRKIEEAFIAIKIDQQRTKEEILTDYLNTIYFGRGAYGIQSAAQTYFGKDVEELTVQEAALLAGIIPSPGNWDPAVNPERAQQRFDYVLAGMRELGYGGDAAAAGQEVPETVPYEPTDRFAGPIGYLLAAVREEVLARTALTENDLDRGGLRIVSTFDKRVQESAIRTARDPEVYPTEGRPDTVQLALVSIDPGSGAVRAMYGGDDYLERQRNSVTQDVAQAGSTFKPFTLVAALEQEISLRTRFDGSSPQEFPGFYVDEAGRPQEVNNFGGADFGRIDLVEATASSVNTVYVALNEQVGPEATRDAAVRAGIPEAAVTPAVPSNVLGTPSVTPLDMGQAFATFAAQGVRHDPHVIATIEQDGAVVYEADPGAAQVFDAEVMADATYAMTQVVEQGSGEFASRLGRPAAGKTGTSNDNRSAWFVGYVPQLATAVALYNVGPDGEQLEMPGFGGRDEITGGSFPVRIWTRHMEAALEGVEVVEFPERADVGQIPESQVTPTRTPAPTTPPPSEPTTEPPTTPPPTEPTQPPTEPPPTEPTGSPTDGATEGSGDRPGGGDGDGGGNNGNDGGGNDGGGNDGGGNDGGGNDGGGADGADGEGSEARGGSQPGTGGGNGGGNGRGRGNG